MNDNLLLCYAFNCPHCRKTIRMNIYSAVSSNGKNTAEVELRGE